MKFLKFHSGKIRWLSNDDYDWTGIINAPTAGCAPDARFTLYYFNQHDKDWMGHTVLFDFDDLGRDDVPDILDAMKEEFGNVGMFWFFTGNGHHVYIPIRKHFNSHDCRQCLADYTSKYLRVHAKLGGTADVKFYPRRYGRAVGSTNTKNGTTVEYMGANGAPMVEELGEIFEVVKRPIRRLVTAAVNETEFDPYNFCAYIKYCESNVKDLSRDYWFKAISILANAGQYDKAVKISEDYPEYSEEELNKEYESGKKYSHSCVGVQEMMDVNGENVCASCPHWHSKSFPHLVSGVLPTPSVAQGHHRLLVVKRDDGETDHVVDYKSVDVVSAVNYLINVSQDSIRVRDGQAYKWTGRKWETKFPLGLAKHRLAPILAEMIRDVPTAGFRVSKYLKESVDYLMMSLGRFKAMPEPVEGIPFKNGLYDIRKRQFIPEEQSTFNTFSSNMAYNESAECPKWLKFLDEVVKDDSMILFLQEFMGVAMSSLKSVEYETMLWLHGPPGSGKSTIARIVLALAGQGNYTTVVPSDTTPMKGGNVNLNYVDKKVILVDDFPDMRPSAFKPWETFFKVFTTGIEGVSYEEKYVVPAAADPRATLLVTANDSIPIYSKTSPLYRRVRSITCPQRQLNPNRGLSDELLGELDGIAVWGLEGFKRYLSKRGFTPPGEAEKNQMDTDTDLIYDPLNDFVRNDIVEEESSTVGLMEMYEVFVARKGLSKDVWTYSKYGRRFKKAFMYIHGADSRWRYHRTSDGISLLGFKIKEQ